MPATPFMPVYHSDLGRLRMLAGERALDLANTMHWRDGKVLDFVTDYKTLVDWCVPAGMLSEAEAKLLSKRGRKSPTTSQAIFQEWVDLRATFHRALKKLTDNNPRKSHSVKMLQSWTSTIPTTEPLALPLQRCHLAIMNLLSFEPKGKIRQCEGNPCGGYFLDQSRAKPRRWCSMDSCGNRAKIKRFRGQGEAMLSALHLK